MAKRLSSMFNLTEMTGRQSAGDRQVTMWSFDMSRRTQIIILGTGLPGLLVGGLLFPLLSAWAVLIPLTFLGLGFYFFHLKSEDGLEQRKYKQFLSKYKSRNNKFMRGMEETTIGQYKMDWIVRTIGEVPFDVLDEPIKKIVDHDRWEREEQLRYQEHVWTENQLKQEIRNEHHAKVKEAKAKRDRWNALKESLRSTVSSLKSTLLRMKSGKAEGHNES